MEEIWLNYLNKMYGVLESNLDINTDDIVIESGHWTV